MAGRRKSFPNKKRISSSPQSTLKFLRQLQKVAKIASKRKKLIKNANGESLRLVSECALNWCNHNLEANPSQTRILNRHEKSLQKLASKKTGWRSRKKILSQKGGFLPALLSVGLPILTSILNNL
jgi:Ni,Fe-hydrogenase I large subunit